MRNGVSRLLSFFGEVKREFDMVQWVSRSEVMIYCGVVLTVVFVSVLFFLFVDFISVSVVNYLLGFDYDA